MYCVQKAIWYKRLGLSNHACMSPSKSLHAQRRSHASVEVFPWTRSTPPLRIRRGGWGVRSTHRPRSLLGATLSGRLGGFFLYFLLLWFFGLWLLLLLFARCRQRDLHGQLALQI